MTDTKIKIFDIQRFCVHDGPGIRTTVFFNGCPLHCPWCSNPESQRGKTELMHLSRKCTHCGRCYQACPNGAISFSPESGPVFDREKCLRCGTCCKACLSEALHLSGREETAGEIMALVRRDKRYYEKSGGGITVSGGEPYLQADGLSTLLRMAKEEGFTTAVETTGNVPAETFKKALGLVDTYLFDLKHADAEILQKTVGGNLPLILENLKLALADEGSHVIIRVPVIPGFNFDKDLLTGIFKLAATCGAKDIDLLPYHVLGRSKYLQLGLEYQVEQDKGLEKKELIPFAAIGEQIGLNVTISGKKAAEIA